MHQSVLLNALKKLKIAPKLLYYKFRGGSARNYGGLWNRYWSSVENTGAGGEVLWDTENMVEMQESFERFSQHMDMSLPFLDLGCGNGRRSRFLAPRVSRVLGIDVAAPAIELAQEESRAFDNLEFRVADAVDAATVQRIHAEFGDMNIYMRGVYHVIMKADRPAFAANLATLLGERGTLYQIETDGAIVDYMLARPDETPTGLPRLMHKVVSHGILPEGFGQRDQRRWYPASAWNVIDSGDTIIQTLPLPDGKEGQVPAYYVLARSLA